MAGQPSPDGDLHAAGVRIALVVSRFHAALCERLLDGALDLLRRHGAGDEDVTVARVPGSFELPLVADRLARGGEVDAVVCLGVLIRGETAHFDLVASEAARGIASASRETGVPITFGVVTAESPEQAAARSGGELGNRGTDAAAAALEMVHLMRRMEL